MDAGEMQMSGAPLGHIGNSAIASPGIYNPRTLSLLLIYPPTTQVAVASSMYNSPYGAMPPRVQSNEGRYSSRSLGARVRVEKDVPGAVLGPFMMSEALSTTRIPSGHTGAGIRLVAIRLTERDPYQQPETRDKSTMRMLSRISRIKVKPQLNPNPCPTLFLYHALLCF